MKTVFFLSGLLGAAMAIQSLAAPAAYSEPEDRGRKEKPAEGAAKRQGLLGPEFIDRLTERLKLSDTQQRKVKGIVEQARPEMEKLEAEMKAAAAKLKAAMQKTREAIRETLDIDQKERFDDMSARMKAHGQHRRRGMPGEERRERVVIEKHRDEAPDDDDGPPPHPSEDDAPE